MPDPHWENLKEIFHAAVALGPDERRAYLDRACDGDASLRQAVESLIKSHEETGFVDQPAYQAAADLLMQDRKLIVGQTVGRYRIVSLIGEGGMGRVYLAEDTKLHRKVSLKFLSTRVTQDHDRRRSARRGIDHLFQKAVELDPKYALAYAALAKSYMWMANFNDPDNPSWVGLAQQSVEQAESLDPQLAEIHSVRFEYYFSKYGSWDLARAAREARQASALNPTAGHYELGIIYDHLGLDQAKGLRETQRTLELDPTNTHRQARLVEAYVLYGRLDEAIETQRRFFDQPGPALALIEKGQLDEAQTLLERAVAKNSGDLRARSALALVLALKGKLQEAEARVPGILEQARNRSYHHVTYDIASVYALDGKTDEAVKWLRTTADTGMPNYPLFARDPHLDRIRMESAFIQFMAELKKRWDGYKQEFEKPGS